MAKADSRIEPVRNAARTKAVREIADLAWFSDSGYEGAQEAAECTAELGFNAGWAAGYEAGRKAATTGAFDRGRAKGEAEGRRAEARERSMALFDQRNRLGLALRQEALAINGEGTAERARRQALFEAALIVEGRA